MYSKPKVVSFTTLGNNDNTSSIPTDKITQNVKQEDKTKNAKKGFVKSPVYYSATRV